MQRPLVLLADSDPRYLRSLELKFLKELGGHIELEVITDNHYFKKYFSLPRSIDVMAVSEEMYSSTLSTHNIRHLFILTEKENKDEDNTDKPGQCIFKYTNCNVIFEEMLKMAYSIPGMLQADRNTVKTVLVTSASGGAGKTTLAMGLSHCLAAGKKRVLYLDAERIHSFSRRIKDNSFADDEVYRLLLTYTQGIYSELSRFIYKGIFDYIPPFKAALTTLGIPFEFYFSFIKEAKETQDYDVIIIDTDSVFDENKARLMTLSDTIIIVVKQDGNSIFTTANMVKNLKLDERYIFVCNDYIEGEDNFFLAPDEKIPFLINEYIHHINGYENLPLEELKNNKEIQKISYVIL